MSKEYQHIVPQVYMKQFGFVKPEFNNKYFVSVRNIEKNIWEDREIKKFLGEHDIYILESFPEIKTIIEKELNGQIEARLPKIVSFLSEKNYISPDLHMAIAETASNLLCRSKLVLNWIKGWFDENNLIDFYNMIMRFEKEDHHESKFILFQTNILTEKNKMNSLMVLFMGYMSKVLRFASIKIIRGNDDLTFFTSDNPVNLLNVGLGELETRNMEIYFPLSPKYLIHFYWPNEPNKRERKIVDIDIETYKYFHKKVIIASADKFIISPIDKSFLGL